jgi:hypothetical protein
VFIPTGARSQIRCEQVDHLVAAAIHGLDRRLCRVVTLGEAGVDVQDSVGPLLAAGDRLGVARADRSQVFAVDAAFRLAERVLALPPMAARCLPLLESAADQDSHQRTDDTHDDGSHAPCYSARVRPSQYGSRNRRLYSLPLGSRGSSGTKSTLLGRL